MWFKSIYLKTLREFRIAILGWGVGMGLLMYVVLAAVPSLIATPAARASVVSLGGTFAWIAEPIALDTPGGYVTWKYGLTILLIAIWSLLAGSRLLRGEEERGSLDALLSLPLGRVRVALEKLAAVWTALLLMGLLIALLAFAGGKSVSAGFGLGERRLAGLRRVGAADQPRRRDRVVRRAERARRGQAGAAAQPGDRLDAGDLDRLVRGQRRQDGRQDCCWCSLCWIWSIVSSPIPSGCRAFPRSTTTI